MSEQRTHDASGLLICQHCGVVLKTRSKNCRDCGGITSSYSPTVIPVLVINRRPATAPQHLKPENDPLIVERVVVRCKFNAAMTPKPQGFHGSRAFLNEGGGAPTEKTNALFPPEPGAQVSSPGSITQPDVVSQPGGPVENPLQGNVPIPEGNVPRGNLLEEMGTFSAATAGDGLAPSAVPFDSPPNSENQFTDASKTQSGQHLPVQDSASFQSDRKPPLAPSSNPLAAEGGKVIRQAHPSYMVADSFLLVVQDTDGQTISVTQTVEGPEQSPVFGLLPAPSTFNLAASQVMPDCSVSLSGYELSFHDANKEEEFSTAPDVDLSVNIDSRLAFEEGLSRVAALRLQGALGRTGVLGFENPSSSDDIRKKFTRKSNDAEEVSEMITAEDTAVEPPKIKERSVFKPKRVADVELSNKVDSIGDIKPLKPKGNPLAMVGAVVGAVVVLGVMGFVGAQKLGFLGAESGGSAFNATASGSLPKQWHLVLTRQLDVQTIFQDFELNVNQSGSVISGEGRDAIGDYSMTGEIKDNKLSMQKEYLTAGYIWPIMFSGQVVQAQDGSFASGTYVWRKSDHERVQGEWHATLPQPTNTAPGTNPMQTPTGNSMAPPNTMQPPQPVSVPPVSQWNFEPGILDRISMWFGEKFSTPWFTKVAWVSFGSLVTLGGLFYLIFHNLFSPHGKLNRLEKEKYIPSQFRREHAKTLKDMSRRLRPGGLPLGQRLEWRWWKFWTSKNLSFTPELREDNPNLLLLGASGRGKTRLMANMITHDIAANDRAVVIVDSDGTLSELIIDWMSSQPDKSALLKRTIAIDPTRDGASISYNPLQTPEPANMQTAASALVHGFKAIYAEPPGSQTSWNAQTANILRNSAVLLMANQRTLVDLPALLQDNDFRDIMLERVERLKDQRTEYVTLLEAWAQYKKLARTDQWINWVEPILNRVSPVLSDPRIRPILTAPDGQLSLEQVVQEKKILIVKLPQGELDQNASLLGSLIVTGVQQAAITLKRKKKNFSRRVSMYLDDLDTFVEQDTLENLAQEFRRYQISVTGSLKTLQHLQEDYRNKLVVNIHTYCVFSLAKKDADILGGQMFRVDGRKVKTTTLQNVVNPINSVPNFELIMDEEKLNVDRLVGQAKQTFFCYSFGSVASVFQLRAEAFPRNDRLKPDEKLAEMIYTINSGSRRKAIDKSIEPASESRQTRASMLSVAEADEDEPEPRDRLNFDLRRAYY